MSFGQRETLANHEVDVCVSSKLKIGWNLKRAWPSNWKIRGVQMHHLPFRPSSSKDKAAATTRRIRP